MSGLQIGQTDGYELLVKPMPQGMQYIRAHYAWELLYAGEVIATGYDNSRRIAVWRAKRAMEAHQAEIGEVCE